MIFLPYELNMSVFALFIHRNVSLQPARHSICISHHRCSGYRFRTKCISKGKDLLLFTSKFPLWKCITIQFIKQLIGVMWSWPLSQHLCFYFIMYLCSSVCLFILLINFLMLSVSACFSTHRTICTVRCCSCCKLYQYSTDETTVNNDE